MKRRLQISTKKFLKKPTGFVPTRTNLKRTWANMKLVERLATSTFAVVIAFSVVWPAMNLHHEAQRYKLNAQAKEIVGEDTPENLAKFITTDQESGDLIFKKDLMGQTAPGANDVQQKGGNYSVTFHKDPKKGVTYYDPDSTQGFSIVPEFDLMAPKQSDGHIVMPLERGSGQKVITLKGNGVKEDIILNNYQGDSRKFSYKLNLPTTMEAKLTPAGEVEIYTGSDNVLFGQISYGSDKDKELVQAAQKHAKKDKLVFVIPTPIIKQAGSSDLPPETQAKFVLKDDILTVETEGLKDLQYPLSIDPSVIVTAANDFDLGMDGGDVDASSGNIQRASATSVNVSLSLNPTNPSPATNRSFAAVAAYNNKIYVLGGCTSNSSDCATVTTNVEVGTILSNGQITWLPHQNSNDLLLAVYGSRATIYNGYIYMVGGITGAGGSPVARTTDVYYASINSSTGNLNGWNLSANSFSVGIGLHALSAYGGYLYVSGGCTGIIISSGVVNCVSANLGIYSARIKPGGSNDVWSSTGQSINSTGARQTPTSSFIYDKKLYVSNNIVSLSTGFGTLSVYSIDNDGSLSELYDDIRWNGGQQAVLAKAGFVYTTSGAYPMNSAGLPTTAATHTVSLCHNSILYKLSIYCPAGLTIGGAVNTTLVGTFSTSTSLLAGLSTFGSDSNISANLNSDNVSVAAARTNMCTVAYDGYLYLVGGSNNAGASFGGGVYADAVKTAPLSVTGGIGSWNTITIGGTNFFARIGGNPSYRGGLMCEAFRGQLYIMGGRNTSTNFTDIQVSTINKGEVGPFTVATGKLSTNRVFGSSAVKYNTNDNTAYLYAFGGGNTSIEYGKIEYFEWGYSSGSRTAGNVVTLTVPVGHSFVAGNRITVTAGSGVGDDSGYNVVDASITSVTATQITYTQSGGAGADGSAGTGAIVKSDVCGRNGSNWDCTSGAGGSDLKPSSVSMPSCLILSNWQVKEGHKTLVDKDTVYMIAGLGDNGVTSATINCTWRASINTNGSEGDIGSWTQGTSLTNTRRFHTAAIWNGYIYVAGGIDGSANNLISTEKAAIGSSGVLGTWGADTTITGTSPYMHHHVSVVYSGYLYVLGGIRVGTVGGGGTASNLTNSTYINNGGSGGTGSVYEDTDDLPLYRHRAASYAYDGYIYTAGGLTCTTGDCSSGSTLASSILKSSISYGEYGAWTSAGTLATPRHSAKMFIYNNKMYVVGGCGVTSVTDCFGPGPSFANMVLDSVESGTINSSHDVGTLTTAGGSADIGTGRAAFGLTQYNGRVYIAGGCTTIFAGLCTTALNTLTYSQIDSSGNLSAWETAPGLAPSFTGTRSNNFLTAYNGYLYVGGGETYGVMAYDDVQYAAINSSNGSVDSWFTDPHRIEKTSYSNAAIQAYGENGFLHVLTYLGNQTAPIGNNGALNGGFNTSNQFANTTIYPYGGYGFAYYKGYAYQFGGTALFTVQNWSLSFPSHSLPKSADYERWIDTDVDTTPINFLANGTRTGNLGTFGGYYSGYGGIQIKHKDTADGGSAWGTSTYFDPGVGSIFDRTFNYTVSGNQARSYLINIYIDDSQTATFPLSTGNTSTVTEFSFYYHPNSGKRLRHGGTFTGEVKQSLDAAPQ